jgi:DNA-3-methyladenine glycosylase
MKLGAHLSIAGDINNALKDAKRIGANTLQIFSGPPRNWKKLKRESNKLKNFRSLAKKNRISPVFVHAKYLVNLSSNNLQIRKKSIESLVEDLVFSQKIKAAGVIFHPHPKNLNLLVKNIRKVLEKSPKSTYLLLENSAQTKLEKIGMIIKKVKDPRLKFCLDTAHTYQAGYNLNKPSLLENTLKTIEKKIGFDRWIAIHINDSKTNLGSHHDQHADILEGKIKPEVFFVLLNHPVSSKLPFILETPAIKSEGLPGDIKNLSRLNKLVGQKLNKSFFQKPTLKVAKQLLGKYLIIKDKKAIKIGKIVETEAYVGLEDKASHASRGKTPRTKTMFGPAGRLYVYLIYGMYHCLNIVTEKRGYPAAVLIRAIEPVFGIEGKSDGPGKLCRELRLTREHTGLDVTKSKKIFIKDIGIKPKKIISTPRIGVDYAGKWAKKKWRFLIKR